MERNSRYRKIFLLLGIILLGLNTYGQFSITSVNTDDISCRVGYGQITVSTVNRTGDVFYGLYNKPPFPPTAGLISYEETTEDLDSYTFLEVAAGTYYVVAVDLNSSDVEGQWITLSNVQVKVLTADAITVVSGPTCYGWNDAVLQANASGGNPPYTYVWNPGGVSGQQFTTASAPGIYSVTVNDSYNCDTSSYSDQVEGFVYPLSHPSVPDPVTGGSILASDPAVCTGQNPGAITSSSPGAGGTESFTYNWESSTTGAAPWTPLGINNVSYDPPVLAQTTYLRRVATDAICGSAYSNIVEITVNPLPTVYNVGGGGSYCAGGAGVSITLSGSQSGISYELYLGGSPTGTSQNGTGSALSFTNVTAAGTYTILATNGSTGCQATMSGSAAVSINPLPTQYNVGGGGSYCAGGTGVTITLSDTESGINYELYLGGSPTGNIIAGTGNPVSFPNITTAGTYTIWATNAGTGCQQTMSGNAVVAVNPLPTVYNVGGGGSYCAGGTGVNITLSDSESGVNYELYLGGAPTGTIAAGTGNAISFANITIAGTYTIMATNAGSGCQQAMNGSVAVSINPLPSVYNIGGGGGYCAGGTGVNITLSDSESGINYELYRGGSPTGTILAGSGSALTFTNVTTAGTYTILASNTSSGCQQTMNGSVNVSVNPLPTVYSVGGGGSYCAGGTGVSITLSDTESGVNYELYLAGAPTGNIIAGTGNAISFPNITTAGTYTIVATNTGTGCQNTMSGSAVVSIDPLPTAYSVTGGGSGCADAGVVVGLSGSETNVDYELFRNGLTTGNTVSGTGAAISFGSQFTAGTYTVSATNINTGCQNGMSGSVNVSINPLPDSYDVGGGGSYCAGGTGVSITLSDSQSATRYYLYLNGNPTGTSLSGNGNPLSFDNITTAGTYTIVAEINSTGCQRTMNGSAVVSIDPLPIAYNTGGGGSYCSGGTGVNITLSDSESGVNYELYLAGNPTGTVVAGTGNAISFTNITTAGTYTIVATNTITGCQNNMSGSAVVSIDPLPTVYNVGGGGSYCSGGTGVNITLSDSEAGVNYELYLGGAPTGTIVAGTGNAISFTNITAAGTYTVVATNATTGCQNNMSGSAAVSIDPLPTVYNVGGGGSYCAGGTGVNITLSDSESGVNYELYLAGNPTGTVVAGTGNAISFTNVTTAGAYTIVATNTATTCQQTMSGSANISIDPLPTVYNVGGGGSYCSGGTGVNITLSGSELNLTYELYLDGNPTGILLPGTGSAITFINVTAGGTYTIEAVNTITGCQESMNGSVVVDINPLPTATASSNSPVCEGTSLSLTGGPDLMTTYSWTGPDGFASAVQSPVVSTTATPAMAGMYTLTVTDVNGCINSANTTVIISDIPTVTIMPNAGNTCTNEDLLINALVGGGTGSYDTYVWTGTGAVYLTPNNAVPTVFNSPVAGNYGLTLTVTDDGGCVGTGTATVSVIGSPTSYAGPDTSLCYGGTYQVVNADTTNSDGIQWVTLGDGTFSSTNILNPVYTPGADDIADGSVKIVLRASGIGGCGNATDTAVIYLPGPIQPLIGAPAPFLIGPNTEIEVCLSTTGHQYIEDLGFYLRSPNGQHFTLKRGLLETNFFLPPCFNFLGGGDVNNLCFTTELTLADTLDLCTEPLPINGQFAATGDWSQLYTMNPAEGGWAVALNDTADFGTGGIDGFISNATISFIDTATATNLLTSVNYSSGAILSPIRDDRMNEILIQRDLQVSCPGECDAVALVTTTGGVPPYNTYVWSPAPIGGNGKDSVILCAGDYEVTVYDALGCSGVANVTVLEPPSINIDDINMTDTLACNGVADGFISVKASGGTGSRRYTLLPDIESEAADSGYFSGLGAGTYTIQIEDAKGCYRDTTLTIYEPSALVLGSALVTDSVFCTGDNNGRIVATAGGGTQPYTFILDPPGITNSTGEFTGLAPGSYVVKLTDANNCDTLISDTLILGVPVPLEIDTIIIDSVVCNGDDGMFTVVVTGGTPPYDILVNGITEITGVTDTAYIARSAGSYDISVTDARLCTDSWATITLTDPPVLTLTSLILTPVTGCYTNTNGEILVNVAGGIPPYEYSLDGITYQPANQFTGLMGGNYTVYYRDALGCEHSRDTTMLSPPQLLGNPVVTNVEGDNLGAIELFPSGGAPFPPPNEYLVSFDGGPLDTILLFEDLAEGAYDVHLEDSEGCAWDSTIIVGRNDLDVLVVAYDADCYDDPSGEIRIWINDGTAPYDIYLDGELQYNDVYDNFRTLPSVFPGTYLVRVEDVTSRRFDTLVTVSSPPPIDIEKQRTNVDCHEFKLDGTVSNNGAISYESSGGAGGFTYIWDDTDSRDSTRTGLTRGTYVVSISDRNGCTIVDTTHLIGQDTIGAWIEIYPEDPMGDYTQTELQAYPSSEDQTLCFGSNWHLLARYSNNTTHSLWSPDTLLDYPENANEIDVTATINGPRLFRLEAWNDRCMDYDEIELTVFDTIGMSITTEEYRLNDSIFSPETKPLELAATEGYQAYLWQAADLFDDETARLVTLTPTMYQIVTVFGTTSFGCYESDTVFVVLQQTIEELYEVFTPNNDGHNDMWIIPNAIQYPDLEVLIFNRWGQQVFYSKPYGIDIYHTFDGRSQKNGKDLPVGSYYFVINPNDGEQDPITGTVTIVR
ncbi:MAG: gliding motility-associated C-terminal domain-containing protein [Bacteroidales bacterium]|nr:gliding motility-associated C-terminal domain-containing protein [Bacteroidales bacterium]